MTGLFTLSPPHAQVTYSAIIVLVLTVPLGTLLAPLIIFLLLLSKPAWWRRPVFWMNIIACLGGIAECVLWTYIAFRSLVYSDEMIRLSVKAAAIAFCITFPVVVDSILLARLFAFYPIRDTPWKKLALVYTLPVFVKVGRVVISALYLLRFIQRSSATETDPMQVTTELWPRNPLLIAEWGLQMVDNLYSSIFFLSKFALFCRKRYSNIISQPTLITRFRGFFLICLGNFIFPICLNIVQIIFIAHKSTYMVGAYVAIANNFVSIICVGFATVWAGAQYWGINAESGNHEELKTNTAYVSNGHKGSQRILGVHHTDTRRSRVGAPKFHERVSHVGASFPRGPSPFPFRLERFSFTTHSLSSSPPTSAKSMSAKGHAPGNPRTGPLILRSLCQAPDIPSETNPPLLHDRGFDVRGVDSGKDEASCKNTTEADC